MTRWARLAKNFNEMQEELEAEEKALKSAHALAQAIYNLTPAMLYSVDRDGQVSAVSDYWLLATGFLPRRCDRQGIQRVLGSRFA